jgi:hypothetical protein
MIDDRAALPPGLVRASALTPGARYDGGYAAAEAATWAAPLLEIKPETSADSAAALAFALGCAAASTRGLLIVTGPDHVFQEHGALYAEGLAHFGLDLDRLVLVRTRTQDDALWAAEQALSAPMAHAVCLVPPSRKPLTLLATRRMLLAAERRGARCTLLRLDGGGASAAWMRWTIAAAPSVGSKREVGSPVFSARLERYRFGPAGLAWMLHWNVHERRFVSDRIALDGRLAPGFAHRSPDARRSRAA